MSHLPGCPQVPVIDWFASSEPCTCSVAEQHRTAILAALRAEIPRLSCYEPSRLIGTPCSCVVGMVRAIEIVEGMA